MRRTSLRSREPRRIITVQVGNSEQRRPSKDPPVESVGKFAVLAGFGLLSAWIMRPTSPPYQRKPSSRRLDILEDATRYRPSKIRVNADVVDHPPAEDEDTGQFPVIDLPDSAASLMLDDHTSTDLIENVDLDDHAEIELASVDDR